MILTVTMNPSVDISYPLEMLRINDVNRVQDVHKTAGGKGLNVSRVLSQMEAEVLATGVLGGTTGQYIVNQLNTQQIPNEFLTIEKESRNCVAILHDGNQTEILESGPALDSGEGEAFLNLFDKLCEKAIIVAISGSLPGGLPEDYYNRLIDHADQKETRVFLDTSGKALQHALAGKAKPYLIKPNLSELSALVGKDLTGSIEEMGEVLSDKRFEGISFIVVSMGEKGAFAKVEEAFYDVTIPQIPVVNPVGSGDATIAGLANGIEQKLPIEDILKMGMTAGMLNTMNEKTGSIDMKNYEEYFNQVQVKKVTH